MRACENGNDCEVRQTFPLRLAGPGFLEVWSHTDPSPPSPSWAAYCLPSVIQVALLMNGPGVPSLLLIFRLQTKNAFIARAQPQPHIIHLESRYRNSSEQLCSKCWTHSLGQQVSVWLSSLALGIAFHANSVHTRHFDTSSDVSIYFCLQKMMGRWGWEWGQKG